MPSFDIVSEVDLQEVDNAVQQAKKELAQRYDFKGSKSEIEWEGKGDITVLGDDDYKLKAVIDILQGKLVKRGISLKALDYQSIDDASGGMKRQVIKLQQGISKEKGKEVVKIIKGMKIKVQAQIMEDQVRVTGKKRDDLQEVMQELKGMKSLDIDLQFTNMRD
ncbi:MAG: YajQ family cyclic di-GMP-binding protein [Thermodesulfobacteriota bacterium]